MRLVPPLLWCACLLVSATASAQELLGVYVGAGAGQSQLQQNYYQIDTHVTGWKVLAGWRPLSAFGAEVEYLDFGSKDVTYVGTSAITHATASAKATALFAVAYLPVPEPWLDIYAKAGAARLQSNASASYTATCQTCLIVFAPTTNDTTSTRFAFGAGAQFKFGLPAVRLEYERVTGSQGDQALLSLAVTVNF
jgi:opacity protein-like surface antigen